VQFGRRCKFSPESVARLGRLHRNGHSIREIAKLLGIGKGRCPSRGREGLLESPNADGRLVGVRVNPGESPHAVREAVVRAFRDSRAVAGSVQQVADLTQ